MAHFYIDNKEEKVSFQEFRKDGNGSFVELLSGMLYLPKDKRKIILNFNLYDNNLEKGSKIKATIPIYIDAGKALAFAKFLSNGDLERKKFMNDSLPDTDNKKKILFMDQGGTNAFSLQKKGKPRKDGMGEARIFTLEVGESKEYIFKAVVGPGRVKLKNGQFDDSPNARGLVVLAGKPDKYIQIGFDKIDLLELASEIEQKVLSMRILEESKFQNKLREHYKKKNIPIQF